MRLLYCIDSLTHGGAERSLASFVAPWVAAGTELHVLVQRDLATGLQSEVEQAGGTIHVSNARGRVRRVADYRAIIRAVAPDVVHTTLTESDIVGRIAARAERVPVSSSLVNVSYGPEHYASVRPAAKLHLVRTADAATARLTSRLHAVSSSVADAMAERIRYPRNRIDVIPRGRDFSGFESVSAERRSSARAELELQSDGRIVLAIASHYHRKDLDVLITALPQLRRDDPRVELVVLGREGAETGALRAAVEHAGLEAAVRLEPPVTDVRPWLLAADVFVLPSRREGFPGALLEAMAVGLPVVATRIPPVEELLGDVDAGRWLIRAESPEAVREGIRAALAAPGPHAQLHARAREFDLSKIAADMLQFLERVRESN